MVLYATVEDVAEVKLSGNLAVSHTHDKRDLTFDNCEWYQQDSIRVIAGTTQVLAAAAYVYISGISESTDRYKTWFGCYTDSNKDTVQDKLYWISRYDFSSFTYDCRTCTQSDIPAYVCACTPQS
jgi:peptidyl-Lys metalloendopeptidase